MEADVGRGRHSQRPQRPLRRAPHRLPGPDPQGRRRWGQNPPAQVPELLPAGAPGDHDLARDPEYAQHPVDVPARGPAAGTPLDLGAVLQVARAQGPSPAQLAEHVAAQRGVGLHPRSPAPEPAAFTGLPAEHGDPVNRIVLGEDDGCGVRPVLEEQMIAPEEPVQDTRVVRTKAAPQDQPVAGRNHADRVELQATQLTDHLQHAGGIRAGPRAGQPLSGDGQAPRRFGGDLARPGRPAPARGYQRPLCTTPSIGRRLGRAIGRSGRSSG